ncbi:PREDICTED: riboflavin kinase [Myotis brandtii]|uniref:riboflavin kinase n=1 Tax=Myotis brandtii TaxID=109478 RepID=UPI0007043FE1|nr:PREDICTED: riboflavin kinase [Myotis brandtii]
MTSPRLLASLGLWDFASPSAEGGGKNFQNFYETGTEQFLEEKFREKVWGQEQEEKGHPGTAKSRKEVWEKRYRKAGRPYQLGIPTANFPEQVVDNLPADVSTGIYYGWASVGTGEVHKMVVSIGWNPYYKNTKKSMETHIMHTFKEDFYGEILNVAIAGYLRPEKNFDSLESLISAIQGDIEEAKKRLDLPEHLKLKEDNFFQVPKSKIMNGH